jgi:hypothetical protein
VSARGSVHWSGYDATALDIEVDPQRCRFGSRKSDDVCVCVFITSGPSTKLFTWGVGGDMGGHVLRNDVNTGGMM